MSLLPLPPSHFNYLRFQLVLVTLLLFANLQALGLTLTHELKRNESSDFNQGCAFVVAGYEFDLCPLMITGNGEPRGVRVEGEQSSTSRKAYEVTLSGLHGNGLESKKGLRSCPEGTWVCLEETFETMSEDSDDEIEIDFDEIREGASQRPPSRAYTRVTSVAGKELPTSALSSRSLLSLLINERQPGKTPPLQLFLSGGYDHERRPQSVRIDFLCGDGVEGLNFVDRQDGLHVFRWNTPHGCPVSRKTGSTFQIAEAEDDSNAPPSGNEGVEQGEELLDPGSGHSKTTRQWVAAIVLFLGVISLCGYRLTTSPQARQTALDHLQVLYFKITPLLSRSLGSIGSVSPSSLFKFRKEESQLVRWAQEDMTLVDAEDVMVNGEGAYDGDRWNADGLDEYIPLVVGPRRSRKSSVRSYGTADREFDFDDNNDGGKIASGKRYFGLSRLIFWRA